MGKTRWQVWFRYDKKGEPQLFVSGLSGAAAQRVERALIEKFNVGPWLQSEPTDPPTEPQEEPHA